MLTAFWLTFGSGGCGSTRYARSPLWGYVSTRMVSKKSASICWRFSRRTIAGVGFEPTTFGLCVPLRLSPLCSICGLDYTFILRSCAVASAAKEGACRLVSTPFHRWSTTKLGGLPSANLARYCHLKGFTEFDRIHSAVAG